MLDRISAANAKLVLAAPHTPLVLREEAESGRFDNFRGAPCAVLMSGEPGRQFADVDCANAVENMALAIGYGADAPTPAPRREGCVNWVE